MKNAPFLVGCTYDVYCQGTRDETYGGGLVYASSFRGACAVLEQKLRQKNPDSNPRDFENRTVSAGD